MSAKAKIDFINSVANGKKTSCPNCNSVIEQGTEFCTVCGAKLEFKSSSESSRNLSLSKDNGTGFDVINPSKQTSIEAPKGIFAEGLPEWNLEPPQVVVRRRRRV